jgi:hypothetical protein
LIGDSNLVLAFPLPDLLEKRISTEVVPSLTGGLPESFLNHGLGGNTSMIEARNEKSSLSKHTIPGREGLLVTIDIVWLGNHDNTVQEQGYLKSQYTEIVRMKGCSPSYESILDRYRQGMADVQGSGDIRWG